MIKVEFQSDIQSSSSNIILFTEPNKGITLKHPNFKYLTMITPWIEEQYIPLTKDEKVILSNG